MHFAWYQPTAYGKKSFSRKDLLRKKIKLLRMPFFTSMKYDMKNYRKIKLCENTLIVALKHVEGIKDSRLTVLA